MIRRVIHNELSVTEVRILSFLINYPDGISPTDLAEKNSFVRDSLYVHLRRLESRKYVSSAYVQSRTVKGMNGRWAIYKITDAGRTARQAFAASIGLNP